MTGPDGVGIRAAASSDLPGIMALEDACFDPKERWGVTAWQAELEGPGLVSVAEVGESGEGCQAFSALAAAACFRLAGDVAELYRIMTAPAWRGLGVATLLLARGFAWASQSGAKEMLLEVRKSNQARSLYVDAGFTTLYERTNYYGPGRHALVMRRELEGNGNE